MSAASEARDYRAQGRAWRRNVAPTEASEGRRASQIFNGVIRRLILGLQLLLSVIPLSWALEFGRLCGLLAWIFARARRREALSNLELALKRETSPEERSAIARASFINLGMVAVEVIRMQLQGPKEIPETTSSLGSASYDDLASRQGILGLSAHLGNFEYIATYNAMRGYGRTALVGRKSGLLATDAFLRESRDACGVETIYSKNGVREMLKTLREGRSIGFVLDQNMRRGVGVFVNFFGVAASTTPALALIAARRNTPVIPTFIVRAGRGGCHKMIFLPAVPLANSGDRDNDLLINTRRFTLVLEAIIRRYPEQWFWVHRRWRLRPPGEAPKSRPQGVEEPDDEFRDYIDSVDRELDRLPPGPFTKLMLSRSREARSWPPANLKSSASEPIELPHA